ncbi:hypothetical protein CPLU01_06028 [Colletotrichum plurivorum]|uniref:Uncharacterized protein n=1 Tax=Colletotrichum plurivorum TaxID=2175906 RepID=A0A8H6KJB6_9PEZI|nr:hypothetical protein CPLU01_06028 [Colletotrichum plurivorum]
MPSIAKGLTSCFASVVTIAVVVKAQVTPTTTQAPLQTLTEDIPSTITPWSHRNGADFIGYYDCVSWTSMRCGRNSFLASDSWIAFCCNSAENSCITAAGKRGDDCVDQAGNVVGICDSGKACTRVTILRSSGDHEKRTFFLCSGAAAIANTWYLTTSTTSAAPLATSTSSAGANVARPRLGTILEWALGAAFYW